MKQLLGLALALALSLTACARTRPAPQETAPEADVRQELPVEEVEEAEEEEEIPEQEQADLFSVERPPGLTVRCGGEEVPVMVNSFTWVVTMPDGNRAALCADAPHPQQMKGQLTALETAEKTALPEFEIPPEELFVRAWEENCTPECDGLSQPVVLGDTGEMELLPGRYLYEFVARWGDGDSCGGTARYVCCIDRLYPRDE